MPTSASKGPAKALHSGSTNMGLPTAEAAIDACQPGSVPRWVYSSMCSPWA